MPRLMPVQWGGRVLATADESVPNVCPVRQATSPASPACTEGEWTKRPSADGPLTRRPNRDPFGALQGRTVKTAAKAGSTAAADKSQKRRQPRWGATVTLPAARPAEEQRPPRVVVSVGKRTLVFDQGLAEFDPQAIEPARRFRSRVGQRHAPQRPFYQALGRHVDTESFTESIAGHLLLRRDDVATLFPQPFWMERVVNGKPSWACPDFLVQHLDGALTVVEVKRAQYRPADSTLIKLDAVRRSCHQLGLGFEVLTGLLPAEQRVFDQMEPFRSNHHLVRADWDELTTEIRSMAAQPTPLAHLWSAGPSRKTKPMVWWMLWNGILCIDWAQSLDESTQVLAHDRHVSPSSDTQLRETWRCGPTPGPTLEVLWNLERR